MAYEENSLLREQWNFAADQRIQAGLTIENQLNFARALKTRLGFGGALTL
jgi:hypothetical protein